MTLVVHKFHNIYAYPTSSTGIGDTIYYSFSSNSVHLRHRRAKLNQDFLDIQQLAPAFSSLPQPLISQPLAIYCGLLFPHFGHFLSESVHRLWAISQLPINAPLLFIPLSAELLSIDLIFRHHRYICEYFMSMHIPLSRILLLTEPLLVSNLFVPTQASCLGPKNVISRQYIDFLNRRQNSIFKTGNNSRLRLAIHRPNIDKLGLRGSIAGQRYLFRSLSSAGFFCTDMVNLSFAEQLDLYNTCSDLIITESSAIHALEIFGTINSRVFLLHRGGFARRQLKAFINLLRIRQCNYKILKAILVVPPLQVASSSGVLSFNRRLAISVLSLSSLSRLITQYNLSRNIYIIYYIVSVRDIILFCLRELLQFHLFLRAFGK